MIPFRSRLLCKPILLALLALLIFRLETQAQVSNLLCSDTSKRFDLFLGLDTSVTNKFALPQKSGNTLLINSFSTENHSFAWYGISKILPTGKCVWSISLQSNLDSTIEIKDAIELSDDSIMVFATVSYSATPAKLSNVLLRLDKFGNIVSYKAYNIINASDGQQYCYRARMCEGGDSTVIILSLIYNDQNTPPFNKFLLLQKFDFNNNLIWSKYWGVTDNDFQNFALETTGTSLYVTGLVNRFNDFAGSTDLGLYVSKIDIVTGVRIIEKTFLYSSHAFGPYYSGNSIEIKKTNSGKISVLGQGDNDLLDNSFVYLTLDTFLNVINKKVIKGLSPSDNNGYKVSLNSQGNFAFVSQTKSGDFYYMAVDSSAVITQSRKLTLDLDFSFKNAEYSCDLDRGNNLHIYLSGLRKGLKEIAYYKTNIYNCDTTCIGRNSFFDSLSILNLTVSTTQLTVGNQNLLEPYSFHIMQLAHQMHEIQVCESVFGCDSLKILGPDTICSVASPVLFKATKQGTCCSNVQWLVDTSAFSKMEILNDSVVAIAFKKEFSGFLHAQIQNSCGVFKDSMKLTVLKVAGLIKLGSDTSVCYGDSIYLDAGGGFSSYEWNTGSTRERIMASSKGVYNIKAVRQDGCYAQDTIIILDNYPLPAVSINPRTILCNKPDSLDAGVGFTSYVWSNGSTERFLEVDRPGNYWVTVTGPHSCINSDSVKIFKLADSPSNFIYTDTAICQYEHIILKTNTLANYKMYQWNDNSNLSLLEITKPGLYSLQVTDSNNCKGKIIISVKSKICTGSIIFPNAFTPNNDGYNDKFKPITQVAFRSFHLSIFNRWGQLVFQTDKAAIGWDGSVNGKISDSGTFIWVCNYQFFGGNLNTLKGSIVLIR